MTFGPTTKVLPLATNPEETCKYCGSRTMVASSKMDTHESKGELELANSIDD